MPVKTANLYVRIEPETKERAENILQQLGIPASSAINMMYKQIILCNGLPFPVRLPGHPLDASRMTDEEIDAELEKGELSMRGSGTRTVDQVFARYHREKVRR